MLPILAGSVGVMPRKPAAVDPAALASAAAALEAGGTLPRPELAGLVRAICGALAQRYPGGAIELRVPPYAAVQLALDEAGRHRRGTPPNVVECSPETLLALAAGRLSWDDGVARHDVRASGIRSDLSAAFPLVVAG